MSLVSLALFILYNNHKTKDEVIMQVIVREPEEASPSTDTASIRPQSTVRPDLQITAPAQPSKAAYRKFVAENNLQLQAMPDELVDLLIKYGNNPDGIPALLYAAKMGDFAAVKLLIQHGADPFTRAFNGGTALHYALLSKNAEMVEFFLNKGIDPNVVQFSGILGEDILKLNDVKSFELLIAYGLKLKSEYYPIYSPRDVPALACISYGCLELLKLILCKGGDLPRETQFMWNKQDPVLSFGLEQCPGRGNEKVECLKWLVQAGILKAKDLQTSDVNLVNNLDPEVLEYLIDNFYLTINQKLTCAGNAYDGYLLHLCFYQPKLVRVLIQKGANVNVKTSDGNTPLHYAAGGIGSEYIESIKILLSNGADVNARDNAGQTPLKRATDPTIRRLLISYGAIE